MTRKVCGLTFIALLSTMAFAQTDMMNALMNIDAWFADLTTYAETYRAGFANLAYALATLGFVSSVVYVAYSGALPALNGAVLRLIIASALVASAPSVSTTMTGVWKDLRSWSGAQMQETFSAGADEFDRLATDTGLVGAALTAGVGGAGFVASSAKEAAYAAGRATAANFLRWLNIMVIPIATIAMIANFIILGSGISIFIACAFLPVAGAMIAISPRLGGEWIGRIVSVVVTALLVTAFMPLIFKAVFDLTVVQPVKAVNEEFASWQDMIDPELNVPPRLAEIERELSAARTERAGIMDEINQRRGLQKITAFGSWVRVDQINARINSLQFEASRVQAQHSFNQLTNINKAYEAVLNEVMKMVARIFLLILATIMASGMMWYVARNTGSLAGGLVMGGLSRAPFMVGVGGGAQGMRGLGPGSSGGGGRQTVEAPPALPAASSSAPSPGGGRMTRPEEAA